MTGYFDGHDLGPEFLSRGHDSIDEKTRHQGEMSHRDQDADQCRSPANRQG
jgi:hypothetical protein